MINRKTQPKTPNFILEEKFCTKIANQNTGLYTIHVQERRLKWFGHLCRDSQMKRLQVNLTMRQHKDLCKATRRSTLHRVIERDLNSINSKTKDAKIKVRDRENYHENYYCDSCEGQDNRSTIY